MQTPEMIESYRPPLATSMPVMGTYGPKMGPPRQHIGPYWQHMGPPGPGMEPSGQHFGPSVQHMEPPKLGIGPYGQHMGPSGQHIGPSMQHMEPPGPGMGHYGYHMAPSGQHMGPGQHIRPPGPGLGPPGQHMEPSGPSMGPTGPNTGSLAFIHSFIHSSGPQMGYPGMPPIPEVQPIKPNYSVPNPNLLPVQPVSQPAADHLWVETISPTVQLQPNQIEVPGHNTQPLKLYFDHLKTHLPSAMVQPAMVQSAVVRPQVLAFLKEINTDTEASQAQTSVQQNAAKDVNTDSDVSSDESEEEVVEKRKRPKIIEEKKPESKTEQKPGPKAEQKPATKSGPVASTPIPGTVWCVVQTNDGKHFFYNPTKRQSVWKMPEELKNRLDVEKILSPKPEVKTEIKEKKDLQEEPPSKKIKLEVEVKEEKEESSSESTQEIVFKKETTNAVKVQAAENMLVSLEDRRKKFKEMLAENNVSTCSTWEKQLHKVVNDKNYMLLTSRERKQAFQEYVNDRAEEERKERKRNSELFRQLLEESNLNVKSTFRRFAAVHSHDKRFKMILRPHDRKHMFEDYINELVQQKKKNALIREKVKDDFLIKLSETPDIDSSNVCGPDQTEDLAWLMSQAETESPSTSCDDVDQDETEDLAFSEPHREKSLKTSKETKGDFMKMLSEISDIDPCSFWDVKNKVSSDPRYKAVSDSCREDWLLAYVKTVRKVKNDFKKMLSEIPDINPSTNWSDVKNKVSSDPRYKAVSDSYREEWFKMYLNTLMEVKGDFMTMLSKIPGIDHSKSWGDVKNKVSSDLKCKFVNDSCREEWFKMYLKTLKEVKDDFMKMLSEIPGINPSTSWERDVKHKVYYDPRYMAVRYSHREEWFKAYLKTMKEVKDDFMTMLSEIPDIDPSTSWGDVKNKVSSDPRYKAVSDTHQEEWFKTYLNTLMEVKDDFIQMLSEIPGIDPRTRWSDVKNKMRFDPRYKAVSGSHREEWFTMYLKTIKEVKDDFMKMLSEIPDIDPSTSWDEVKSKVSSDPRYMAVSITRRKEWLHSYLKTLKEVKDDFMKMLSEIPDINPSTTWDDVKNKVSSDPRYTAVSDSRQEEWFKMYLKTLKEVKDDFMKRLNKIPGIDLFTSWGDVKNKVRDDPQDKFVSDSCREEWFKMYMKTLKEVRGAFMKMLSEISDIDSYSIRDVINKVSSDPRYKAVSHSRRLEWLKAYLKTVEEVKDDFLKMLSEIPDINPSTSWSDVKNKVSSDPRYKAVSDFRRVEWFKTYLKTVKKVKDDFMIMLSEIPDISPITSWSDVKNEVRSDPRYKAARESCREEWIKTYLNTVNEVKNDFMKMLSETPGIAHYMWWEDVSRELDLDPRYKAVGIESRCNDWFYEYLRTENKVKDDFMKMLSEIPDIDLSTSWDDVRNKVSSDPRYKAVSLTRKQEWVKSFLKTMEEVKGDFVKILSEIPDIYPFSRWDYVKNIVSSDPRYKTFSDSQLKKWFKSYMKTMNEVKDDFMTMLSEIPGIYPSTSWNYVKNKVSSDPRYTAVSDFRREEWFKMYLNTMKETRDDFMIMLSEIPEIDTSTSLSDVQNKVNSDPRYNAVSDTRREEWFRAYLKTVKEVKDDFMKMLSEIPGIDTSTSLKDVKNTVRFDPRYKAVRHSHREEWFKMFLKSIKEVQDDFMKMLSEIPGIDPCTSWVRDVKKKVNSDPRYKAVRYSQREELFATYLKTLKAVQDDFMEMLSETPGINCSASWSDVKNRLSSDPRYEAVVSDTRREEWFMAYLKTLKVKDDFMAVLSKIRGIDPSTSWDDVKNKVSPHPQFKAVSDADREEWFKTYLKTMKEVQDDFMKMLSEIPGIDPSTSWVRDVKNKVISDPRYKAVNYSILEEWFAMYLKTMEKAKDDFMEMLNETPGINCSTSWSDVKNSLSSDPRYEAAVSDNRREEWFMAYLKTLKDVKDDFMKMLSQIPGINPNTSWDDVMNKVNSNPRYKTVSDSRQEEWFKTYFEDVKNDFMEMLSKTPGIIYSTLWGEVSRKLYSDPRYKAVSSEALRNKWFYEFTENNVKGDFMIMLSEISDIDPCTSWGDVKNKLSSDPRYKAVSDSCREEWFHAYLKTVKEVKNDFMEMLSETPGIIYSTLWGEVSRKLYSDPRYKAVSCEALRNNWFYEFTENNVKGDFMTMLSEIPDINPCSSWDYVKNQVSSDPRYKAVSDSRREEWFHAYLKTVKDVQDDFMEMLSETPGINCSASWSDVKNKMSSDPRYEAAVRDTRREEWFMAYLKTLKGVTPDNTWTNEEQSSLNVSSVKGKDESKKSQDQAANDDFNKFLVEKVTNSEGSFNSFKSKFDADPKWTNELTDAEKKKLYDSHVDEIHKKNREILWSILDGINLSLVTVWDTVKDNVQANPRFVSYTDSEKKQAKEYAVYMHKWYLKAKEDFLELLKTTQSITPETKSMLEQEHFSLKNIEHLMQNDSRFTALTCIREQRDQMILAYVNELSEKTQPPC